MALFLFSLTGLPPFAGFVGKFYLFAAVVKAGGPWNWLLAVVGVLNSVVSLFYYARVVRAMFLEKGEQHRAHAGAPALRRDEHRARGAHAGARHLLGPRLRLRRASLSMVR